MLAGYLINSAVRFDLIETLDGVARGKPGSDLQRAYLAGLRNLIDRLDATSGSDAGPATREREALADLATLVGGLLLARAASGDELSDRVLDAVRHRLGR